MDRHSTHIETNRLEIRLAALADADNIQPLMTAGISRWVAAWPYPLSLSATEDLLRKSLSGVEENKIRPMVIVEKSTRNIIGWIKIDFETTDDARIGEIGYWLSEEAQGNGFAYEAASAVIAACFKRFRVDRVRAGAQAANLPSHDLLMKLGMHKTGELSVYAPARGRHEICMYWEIACTAADLHTEG